MREYVVGVDMGTGAARAVALDADGRLLGNEDSAYGREITDSPKLVHGISGWSDAVLAVIGRLCQSVGSGHPPKALCVGGQSPSTVAGASSTAVTLRHPVGAEEHPVMQHVHQQQLLREITEDEVARPAQIWDWQLGELGAPWSQSRWPGDEPIPGFGPVVETGQVLGNTRSDLDAFPEGVTLVGGAADVYLASWAAGIDVPGRALDPGGRTGGIAAAVAHGSEPLTMYGMRSADPSIDIVGGPVSAHGLMLEWLSRMTGRSELVLLDDAAQSSPGAGGVLVLPYLEGERMPRWNRQLRAEIVGLSSETTVADLARAVLEGSAYGLGHIVATLAAEGVGIDVLICAGSPARSALWCAIKSAVLEVPVEVPACTDLAAYGAALAAGAGCGWWPRPGQGHSGSWPRPDIRSVDPCPDPVYRDGYQRWIALGDEAERAVDGTRRG